MKKAELVFIPLPAMGHLVAAVETAKLMVERDDRISASILIINPTLESRTAKYTESLTESTLPNRFRVVHLPRIERISENNAQEKMLPSMVDAQKPHIEEFVSKLKTQSASSPDSPRLAGFVFDMFFTGMKYLAETFGVPWYVFFVSGAAYLGSLLHLQALHDEKKVDLTQFENTDAEIEIRSLVNRFPAKLLPAIVFKRELLATFLDVARGLSEARGIWVNTFKELEPHAVDALSNAKIPPIYPVGPIVKCEGHGYDVGSDRSNDYRDIMQWLDDQPPSSVVFLCFGSWGIFNIEQVREIARALEHCGHRFLWSLRKPATKGKIESPSDYVNFQEVLSKGFLDGTVEKGKVIGWAPQAEILYHKAVGGFVSHCGWNSILESIWFDVPIATWPIYGEQHFNAFEMVIELGLSVDLKMDYERNVSRDDGEVIVSNDDIRKGVNLVMEQDTEVRKRVKEMSQLSKKSLMDGGSSYSALTQVIADVMESIA